MADEARVEVHGYEELEQGSERLFERIGEKVPERFENIAQEVADAVSARVPRLTGALAASVSAEREDERVFVGYGDEDEVPYAGWIEFGGTRFGRGAGIAERPYIDRGRYLYPAAFNAEPMLVAAGAEVADDEIGRFSWAKPNR